MPEHLLGRAVRRLAGPANPEPDVTLLDRWADDGDHSAFELLVWRYGAMVHATCRRALHPADADDAFQATFLVLVRKARSAGRRGSLGGWLHRVAVRTCRAARRQAATRPLPLEADPQAPTRTDTRELRALLDEELDRLPERFRQVLVLCHLQGKTAEEAAAELGCPRGTVLSRLHRGRERLRRRLTRRGVTPAAAVGLWAARGAAAGPPARLVGATVDVAAGGAGAVGAATGPAAEFAREVLNAMWIKTVRACAAGVVAAVLGAGLSWGAAAPQAAPPAAPKGAPAAPKGARAPAGQADAKKAAERFQGTWTIASLEFGGEKLPDEVVGKMGFAFGPEKVTIKGKLSQGGGQWLVRDGSEDFAFAIDPDRKMAEIDIEIKSGQFARGIYKFDGDDLVLCIDYSRADRPAKFETKDNPAHALYRLKKEK